uniref:Uncharacterized protein n=1 Tax=Oryza nivara TaxID=4536 RepID=A0A0E0FW89_ORYNI
MYRAVLVPVGTKNHPTVESEKGRIGREWVCLLLLLRRASATAYSGAATGVAPRPLPPPERILGRCNRIFCRWLIRLRLRCRRRCVGRSHGAKGGHGSGGHGNDGAEEEHKGAGAEEKHGGDAEEEYGGGRSGF